MDIEQAAKIIEDAGFTVYLSNGTIPLLSRGNAPPLIVAGRELELTGEDFPPVKWLGAYPFWVYQDDERWFVEFLLGQRSLIIHVGLALADVVMAPIWTVILHEHVQHVQLEKDAVWTVWRIILNLQRHGIATGMKDEHTIALFFSEVQDSADEYDFMLMQTLTLTNKPSATLEFVESMWNLIVDGKMWGTYVLDAVDNIVEGVKRLRNSLGT